MNVDKKFRYQVGVNMCYFIIFFISKIILFCTKLPKIMRTSLTIKL